MTFVDIKETIELATGLSQDALHIYAAVLIHLLAAALSRRGLSHPGPWLCVLILELVNESLDLRAGALLGQTDPAASVHDLWNTMLLPTVLLAAARLAPRLFRHETRPTAAKSCSTARS